MRAGTIPTLIAPYVGSFKASSLILITYVLNASANWLLLRFLAAAAAPSSGDDERSTDTAPTGIIFLSFMRDYEFWREGARRIGVDITKLAAQNRFVCVDGLSELFSATEPPSIAVAGSDGAESGKPARNAGSKPAVRGDHVVLRDPKLEAIEKAILDLAARMNSAGAAAPSSPGGSASKARTLLVIDGLDFIMAATEEDDTRVYEMILNWRENVHSLVIATSADAPLLHSVQTPLEINHRNLAVTLAHQAQVIMGLRLLDSGTAKDVSGVLSINRGAYAEDEDEENEFLYFVGGDGQVKVFERGAAVQ